MSQQLSHHTTNFREKKFPLVLILDHISGPANIGSLFRLADAFNIEKILLCGPGVDMSSARLRKTARTTVERVAFEQRENTLDTCTEFLQQSYHLYALEITSNSTPIDSCRFESIQKAALVIGNERMGVDENILKITDKNVHINMFGRNSSMNVAQAAGIALYEITRTLPPI